MAGFVEWVIELAGAYPEAVALIAFTTALLESIAVVGLVVPGTVILLALGALVATGAVNLWELLAWVSAGALIGDLASFFVGRHWHAGIRRFGPLQRNPGLLARGEAFFRRRGVMSVVLGRFLQPTRAIVPMVAGMADMPPRRFIPAVLVSVAIWAPSTILPGVLLGATLHLAAAVSMRLVLILVLLGLAVVLAVVLWRLVMGRGVTLALVVIRRLGDWAAYRDTPIQRLLHGIMQRSRGEGWIVAGLGIVAALSLWAFVVLLEDMVHGSPLARADSAVFNLLLGLRTAWADSVMVVFAALGDAVIVAAVFMVVFALLMGRNARRAAGHWVAGMAGAVLFAGVTAWLLHMPRSLPLADHYTPVLAALPSGHATANAVLYGLLLLLLLPELGYRSRLVFTAAVGLLVTTIAFARVYLGAHALSDVLGGLTFALAWISIVGASYYSGRRLRPLRAPWLASAVALTLVVVGSAHIGRGHADDLARYAVLPEPATLPVSTWQAEGWRDLPAGRIDLAGEVEEPLLLQWAGDPAALAAGLSPHGWHQPPEWTVAGALTYLLPDAGIVDLPVLPRLHDGRVAELTLIRPVADDPYLRHVLRLWPADVELGDEDGTPMALWLGGLAQERLVRIPWLTSWVESDAIGDRRALALLADALPTTRAVGPRRMDLPNAPHVLLGGAPIESTGSRLGAQLLRQAPRIALRSRRDAARRRLRACR